MKEEMYWKDSFIFLFEDKYLSKNIESLVEMDLLPNEGIVYKDSPQKIHFTVKSDKIYLDFVGRKIREIFKTLVMGW